MSAPHRPASPLKDNQMRAVAPEDSVWLSASAGTGKTQVLSSRVLRLLLRPGVEPSQILCLTFTRAGATEMAARINSTLARWVRMDRVALAGELRAIGADFGPDDIARARRLFASVLDCPGGGLRIDTIHAFSQWLLAAFPLESGLQPGARAMEDRDRALLARQVLGDVIAHAESDPLGDPQLLSALADLSLRLGPDKVEQWLLTCAAARPAWLGPGSWQAADMRHHVLRLLGLPADADDAMLASLCEDTIFDLASLRHCHAVLTTWNSATGREGSAAIEAWLALDGAARAAGIETLFAALFTKTGAIRQIANIAKRDAGYESHCSRVAECVARVRDMRTLLALADRLVPALRLGRAFAIAWEDAKAREGLIDFDDQIRLAAELLGNSEMADWIRYKLDRHIDHILVDEAQDTNEAQWRIILALAEEFWAGLGQRGDILRTLFVVGDYKQAIFRFQGTNPENFRAAGLEVAARLSAAARNAAAQRGGPASRELLDLDLQYSFRTTQPVLDFVDKAIETIGHEAFGLDKAPERHIGVQQPGYVGLWAPIAAAGTADDAGDDALDYEAEAEADAAGPNWLSRPDRQMADRIARQVRAWLDQGYPLAKQNNRPARPGDIMVLVRKRRELAGLIVARLHAAGVPVAGVDRLRLGAPLAVRDLLAALRFAVQPLDDLNLAALLVSPLIGWSQDQLLRHGYRDPGVRLWDHLRRLRDSEVGPAVERLGELLRRADFEPPQALIHWLLIGPWQGRRKLVARLGIDANDPINELLNAAAAYASASIPSLAGFLHWFEAGEGELKREAGESAGLVRVMTAHGSKGLQSPIVILADATGNPAARPQGLVMPDPLDPARKIPLPPLRKQETVGRLAEEQALAAREEAMEHWRLLYVAMTRAEEALFIGGALGSREEEPSADSWYARLRALFDPSSEAGDPIWGSRLEWGRLPDPVGPASDAGPIGEPGGLPDWLTAAPAAEPRPPRPLAPSSLGEDETASPPALPGKREGAARRGVLAHRLLERLPDVAMDAREAAGAAWLARNAVELDEEDRRTLLGDVLAVIAHPDWQDLFAPEALAEVPIAARAGVQVIAGTIDRLLVKEKSIRLVDYKTTRRPAAAAEDIPVGILRQMAAYALALEAIYPGREVEAAVLYTATPRLLAIPGEVLARHKQELQALQ